MLFESRGGIHFLCARESKISLRVFWFNKESINSRLSSEALTVTALQNPKFNENLQLRSMKVVKNKRREDFVHTRRIKR